MLVNFKHDKSNPKYPHKSNLTRTVKIFKYFKQKAKINKKTQNIFIYFSIAKKNNLSYTYFVGLRQYFFKKVIKTRRTV